MKVADAASRLSVSPRTIERRIQTGELESRRTEQGREVLVKSVDEPADIVADSLTVIADHDHHQLELTNRLASAYELPIQRANEEAGQARQEARTVRRSSWLMAVGLTVIAATGGYWALQQQGRAALAEHDAQTAAQAATDARRAVADMRAMLESAESRAAQATTDAQKRADEAREAMARSHDLELRLTQLEGQIERDRLAAAVGGLTPEPEPDQMAAADSITENSTETLEK